MSILAQEVRKIMENAYSNGRAILVWYDVDGSLADVIHEAIPTDVSAIEFSGSYLKIRATIDGQDPNFDRKWLIYIPEMPRDPSWIRDYETIIGSKIECTLARILTEVFGLTIDNELKVLLSGQGGRNLARHWNYVMENLSVPMSGEQVKRALLSTAFDLRGTFTIGKALIQYVSFPEKYGQNLETTGLNGVFIGIIQQELGLRNLAQDVPASPERIAAAILFSELVTKSKGLGKKEFAHLLPPENRRHQWVSIAEEWINDSRFCESFVRWSKQISTKYDVKGKLAGLDIVDVQSFADVDEVLLEEICTRITARGGNGLLAESLNIISIAERRSKTLWSSLSVTDYWEIIACAVHLYIGCNTALNLLAQIQVTEIEDFINRYKMTDGWWQLDSLYRKLASGEAFVRERITELILNPSVELYGEWLDKSNSRFSKAAHKLTSWPPVEFKSQRDFWKTRIIKKTESKIAVLLIDALRYDLCIEIAQELLSAGCKVNVEPFVASIPSITEIGMASLLPLEGKPLKLEIANDKLRVYLDDIDVTRLEGRRRWIESHLGSDAIMLSLDEVIGTSVQALKSQIEKHSFVVVTDREIDSSGNFTSDISLAFFKMAVEKLRSTVLKLHEAGIKTVTVGTDHGFLFLPRNFRPPIIEGVSSMGGLIKRRRYLIGKPPKIDGLVVFQLSRAGFDGEGYVALAPGVSTFSIQGETPKFIHGGLSLQEICVAYLTSSLENFRKTKIKVNVQDPITSMKFFVDIVPSEVSPTQRPIKVQIRVFSDSNEIGASEPVLVHSEPCRVWIKLEKIRPEVEIQAIDSETEDTLWSRRVPVQLAGYDELI